MFCDRCGTAVQPDQRFCNQCGRQFSDALVMARSSPNRVQEHVRLVGILWLALSAFNVLAGLVLLIVATELIPQSTVGTSRSRLSRKFPDHPAGSDRRRCPDQSGRRICRRLRTVAPRNLGAHADAGSVIPGAVQRSVRNRARHLQPVGLFPAESEREYEEAARVAWTA